MSKLKFSSWQQPPKAPPWSHMITAVFSAGYSVKPHSINDWKVDDLPILALVKLLTFCKELFLT